MKGLSQNKKRPLSGAVLCLLLVSIMEMDCAAQDILNLDPPGDLECLVDKANLIDRNHAQKIRSRGKRYFETPIIVVTINKISDHVEQQMTINTFADLLFDQWQIGAYENDGNEENLSKGILMLVAKGESQKVPLTVKIRLGEGWGEQKDQHIYWIITSVILPRFQKGMFSRGIIAGFNALSRMTPEGMDFIEDDNYYVPKKSVNTNGVFKGHYSPPLILAIVLGLWTLVSVWLQGSEGLAWRFWSKIFSWLTTFKK